jgi:hypothetical protein
LGSSQSLFSASTTGPLVELNFEATTNTFRFYVTDATVSVAEYQITTAVFRDPAAWYHVVVAYDTTQATDTNRIKFYINGTQVTAFSNTTYPSQNFDTDYNNTVVHAVGSRTDDGYASSHDGCMADVYWIDGQQLTPSSFAETDSQTGAWKPKKYSGTYGTNGFYLPFTNPT